MSNVKEGKEWEDELVEILGQYGFWASRFPGEEDGTQPCDIIALNHIGSHLIDAKDCKGGRFVFSRVEDNQRSSIELFRELCGGKGWFALRYPDQYYMIPYDMVAWCEKHGHKSLGKIPDEYTLEKWINANRSI